MDFVPTVSIAIFSEHEWHLDDFLPENECEEKYFYYRMGDCRRDVDARDDRIEIRVYMRVLLLIEGKRGSVRSGMEVSSDHWTRR
jgi:hypothetical protein